MSKHPVVAGCQYATIILDPTIYIHVYIYICNPLFSVFYNRILKDRYHIQYYFLLERIKINEF